MEREEEFQITTMSYFLQILFISLLNLVWNCCYFFKKERLLQLILIVVLVFFTLLSLIASNEIQKSSVLFTSFFNKYFALIWEQLNWFFVWSYLFLLCYSSFLFVFEFCFVLLFLFAFFPRFLFLFIYFFHFYFFTLFHLF